jgi:S1-C subfamily serine protease
VIGSDVQSDVALLQLKEMPKGVTPATLGDSDKVEVGDQIFVIGAPYGISQTLSVGHLSGRHRMNTSNQSTSVEFLQTDAAINTGNSGGPMFDMQGNVIGIVSSIMTHTGRLRRAGVCYGCEYGKAIVAGTEAILVRH